MSGGFLAAFRSTDARGLARAVAAVFLLSLLLSGFNAAAAATAAGDGALAAVHCLPDEPWDAGGADRTAAHDLCCMLACAAGGALPPAAENGPGALNAAAAGKRPPAMAAPRVATLSLPLARGPPSAF